jgi:hypothetical protein
MLLSSEEGESETPTLLDPIERITSITGPVLSDPTRCPPLLTWGRKQMQFPKRRVLLCSSDYGRCTTLKKRPPIWSSVQSSWLQIQRSGFDFLLCQILWEVAGLERGPLSFVSTTEELFGRKNSGFGLENRDCGRMGSAALTTRHHSIRKR